jgi:hypothetical protein
MPRSDLRSRAPGHWEWQRNSYEVDQFNRTVWSRNIWLNGTGGLVAEDHDALIRLTRLNAAEARKMAQMAKEAARRSHEACEEARQKLADDIAYIERLKASHARTGIIRG